MLTLIDLSGGYVRGVEASGKKGWIKVGGDAAKKTTPEARVEKAHALVAEMTKRYGITHPMTKRARKALEAAEDIANEHHYGDRKKAKAKRRRHSVLSMLELA